MNILLAVTLMVLTSLYRSTEAQSSSFNEILSLKFDMVRSVLERYLTTSSEDPQNLRIAEQLRILQPRVSDNVPFPCPLNGTRSQARPTSVHKLRPGDIDVVAAIGDSLSAGNGIVATNVLQVYIQNRGLSPTIGGQRTWRQYVTLPNILKEFNSNLVGYSVADTLRFQNNTQLNVAGESVKSANIPSMAEELIKRIRSNSNININSDWKMISVLVGGNDFCDEICQERDPEIIVRKHREDLLKTLTILRDNLPRTIVNIILTPNLSFLTKTTNRNKPLVCFITQPYLCPCLFSSRYRNQQKQYNQIMRKWQNVEADVTSQPEFDTNDFTVLTSPFTRSYDVPRNKAGLTDYSYLSQDCFHLSQKTGAEAAISIWNNLLEPVGRKSTMSSELYHFKCPSVDQPYIFTRRNSKE